MKRIADPSAVGRILANALNYTVDAINESACLPMSADGQWRVTLVFRNIDDERATFIFGMDDVAALIVALRQLGGTPGVCTITVGNDGETKGVER